jgi:hypothetical protein
MQTATTQSHRSGRRLRILLLPLEGLLVGCAPKSAVQAPVPVRGDPVRVTSGHHRVVYEFRELRADVLVVEKWDYSVSIPRASVDELEAVVWHRSRGSNALRGAAWGFGVGAAVGAILGAVAHPGCNPMFCLSQAETAAVSAGMFGGLGAPLGPIVGAISPTAVWAPVESSALEVNANASPGGLGLQLNWRP